MEVLICERCGKIYPIEHSGILCDCGGKLIPSTSTSL